MANETVKDKPAKIRPPRVNITYDVQCGDAIEKRQLPFVVGVLADLSGEPDQPLPRLRDRRFVEATADNIDSIMRHIAPRLVSKVDCKLGDPDLKLHVELRFRSLEDFGPEGVVAQVPVLAELLESREQLKNLRSALQGNERLEMLLQDVLLNLNSGMTPDTTAELIEQIVQDGHLGRLQEEQEQGRQWIQVFLAELAAGRMALSRETEAMLSERISAIDDQLSIQLNEILHSEPFQKLEATWRGLDYLVRQTETSSLLKIRVLNVSKKELLRDFRKAIDFDTTVLFKKVYEEEYGTLGGAPFAVLIGDFAFGRHPDDVQFLSSISNIGAAASAPFIAAASPEMFNLESFTELSAPRDLAKIFDNEMYAHWRSFRQSEDSRYVGLVLPRILLRLPYARDVHPVNVFDYEERVDGKDHEQYLWGNAAYAFGVRLTQAFAKYGWCAAIRGVAGGGTVDGLPSHTFITDDGDFAMKCPTEIAITDRREGELAKLGFIPLCHQKGTDQAVFFTAQSCHRYKQYNDESRTAVARVSAQLEYTLAICRFAHYLRCMMRDLIGSVRTAAEHETFVNRWISQYVLLDETASEEIKARLPLREARIEVSDSLGRIGAYTAVAYLRPHFQLIDPISPIRVVIGLPVSSR